MTAWIRDTERRIVATRRRPPGEPVHQRFAAKGDGDHGDEAAPLPDEVSLELTDPAGQLVSWCNDTWWLESLRRWKDRGLTLHILPTPDAMTNPVVLNYLDMLGRIVPGWRIIAHVALAEIIDAAIDGLATAACHELRVIDRPHGAHPLGRFNTLRIDELFRRLRETQARFGPTRPALVRLPPPSSPTETSGVPFALAEST